MRPKAPTTVSCCGVISAILPMPNLRKFGICKGPTSSSIWPNVLAPKSPKRSASGLCPIPTLSVTIVIIRLNIETSSLLNTRKQSMPRKLNS